MSFASQLDKFLTMHICYWCLSEKDKVLGQCLKIKDLPLTHTWKVIAQKGVLLYVMISCLKHNLLWRGSSCRLHRNAIHGVGDQCCQPWMKSYLTKRPYSSHTMVSSTTVNGIYQRSDFWVGSGLACDDLQKNQRCWSREQASLTTGQKVQVRWRSCDGREVKALDLKSNGGFPAQVQTLLTAKMHYGSFFFC